MINILPPEYKENLCYGRRNAQILSWLSAVVFGIVILFLVATVGRMTMQTAKNQTIDEQKSLLTIIESPAFTGVEQDYNDFIGGLSGTRRLYERQILYSSLLRKLATLLPPGAKLSNISLTESDSAIALNFDNERDGLGPIIQVNLTNQGDQIADRSRIITENGFGISIGGKLIEKDGQFIAPITTNASDKQISYLVNITDEAKAKIFRQALKNGGEYAYQLLEPEFQKLNLYTQNSQSIRLESYRVDTKAKYIDFTLQANNPEELAQVREVIINNSYGMFADTYLFEDTSYTRDQKCVDPQSREKSCELVCSNGLSECENSEKKCQSITANGCRYIIRGYYDELYVSGELKEINDDERKQCQEQSSLPCTHRVTAQHGQMFEKVDINRVAACGISTTTGKLSCPVEMRAQFSNNAKFYLISAGGQR